MDASLTSSTAIAEPTMLRSAKIQWPAGIKQCFSLPSSIIYYIAMNPSTPEGYNKLIQTCKYFFQRNPILVASNMIEEGICAGDECFDIAKCCVKMDINKITSKIWLTGELRLHQNDIPNFAALLRPKVYRCDIFYLFIKDGAVDFDNFNFFALPAKEIALDKTHIINNNGHSVTLENIFQAFPNVEKFDCCFEDNTSMVSASTVKNLSKLINLGSLKKLSLYNTRQAFCCNDLFAYIKDQKDIKFWFHFAPDISEECKILLDQLTDSVIESQLSNCFVDYFGQNKEKLEILFKLLFKD